MKQKVLLIFCVIYLLLICFPHSAKADQQSEEAYILLKDLSSKINKLKFDDLGTSANNAAWDETSSFLYQRYGSKLKKDLPSDVPHAEGNSTWSTSSLQGKHSRDLQVEWDKAKSKLSVTIKGDAKGSKLGKNKESVGEYTIRINANVVEEKDTQGKTVLRTRLPQKGGIEVFAVGCDEKKQLDFNGIWTDNRGWKWTIKHEPIKCVDSETTITLERTNKYGYTIVHKGTIKNWTIQAKHNIVNPNAVETPEQLWIRKIIASGEKGRASYIVSLSPHRNEDGTLSLEGTFIGFNVTWNPDEKIVRKVFPSYAAQTVLTREGIRIVSVEIVQPNPPFKPLEVIDIGDFFRVKVVFSGPSDVISESVTIWSTTLNIEIQVFAKKTDNPSIFITDPIQLIPPCEYQTKQVLKP